ncbi:hypothetical protein [Mycolicibacterium fortuitum]|uniref:hypothetical protein n=1 Tax=Mycolicibacterium fortuitum TaxID=1766 RepID=UPI00261DEFA5|nr:hypothetical protein [Mycolicibacterium fortuitum]
MKTKLAAAIVAAATAATVTSCANINQTWHNSYVVSAKDVFNNVSSDNDGRTKTTREYRLTTSCGTFEVADSIAGGYNSWDKWQSLQVGHVYDIKTGGFRNGWFSMFPTVLEVRSK